MVSHFDTAKQLFMEGAKALESGDLDVAEIKLSESLRLVPGRESTKNNLSILYTMRADFFENFGEFDRALSFYDKAIELNQQYPIAWSNKGAMLTEHYGLIEQAITCLKTAIQIMPTYSDAHVNLGVAYEKSKNYEEAISSYDMALSLDPNLFEAWNNRGNILNRTKKYVEALESFDRALTCRPDLVEIWNSRGSILSILGRYEEALTNFERAIALKPDYAEPFNNRGNVLNEMKCYKDALASYDNAIKLKPDYFEAWSNRGVALKELRLYDQAIESYDKAIAIKSDYAEAWNNRGNALFELRRHEEALVSFSNALQHKPDLDFVFGMYLHTKMMLCDWQEFDANLAILRDKVIRGERASAPFPLLSVVDEPSLHREAAERYGGEKFPRVFAPMEGLKQAVASPSKKIRIGYFSADFREHAVSYLIAELLESHDRKKFEVFGFSLRESSSDGMRQRIARSCDRFIDLHSKSDQDAGRVIAELQIDIGIDLGGYTKYARTGIFSQKRMPIQAHYLGYIGTMGLDYFDYIVADKTVLPESNKDYFSEKIIYLPNSFQANDSTRQISDKSFTKEELGLPVDGFIFCCFNNNYKIVPQTFSAWMRILKATKGSVLWLFEDSPQVARNLAKEASQRGIDPNRLIFAKHLPRADYMARYKVADLFLDTLPYNAGTTASDALWVGLPVLTCMGNSFAGRMAASLLTNIGLPELVTRTPEEYESLAIEVASNPDKLAQIKIKLAKNRSTTPLFDTPLFTKHIEAAYQAAYDRYQSGLPPDHIYVDP